jgi:hypothetical protein
MRERLVAGLPVGKLWTSCGGPNRNQAAIKTISFAACPILGYGRFSRHSFFVSENLRFRPASGF